MDGSEAGVHVGFLEHTQRSSVSSIGTRSLDVLVYLINDLVVPLTVDGLTSMTAQDLHRIVRETLLLPEIAQDAFALWLVSPLLEVQLKPKHQPYKVCLQWQDLLFRFTECPEDDITQDEPSLQFRRNVFFPKRRELQIEDEQTLRLLYEEAKYNVLEGRYPCDIEDCDKLGGLACRVELGPFDQDEHTTSALREKLDSFLPTYLCKKRAGGLLTAFRNRGAKQASHEQRLLAMYKQVRDDGACEQSEALKKHYRDYLQKCHELPYYGCAFFVGSVDKPAQGFLQRSGRKPVSVAISMEGVYVIDSKEKAILMSGLIEFCIELNSVMDVPGQETANAAASAVAPSVPARMAEKRNKLQRQSSVVSNRLQHLSTIDYVDDGTEIKRVKPRRTASFFSRQSSHGQASYSEVQTAENLEQR